jgi:ferredoxin, 2Fe-2S
VSVRVNVIDREGVVHEVEARTPGTLMETLRELDYGVAAICGGMCSCATCHIYVSPRWWERLDPPHGDERELLSALEHRTPTSRLSCQIRLFEALDGLGVTLAPET